MIEFDVDMSYLLECDELDKVVLNDENGEHEPMEFASKDAAKVGVGTCEGSFHKSGDLSSGRVPLYYCKGTNKSIFMGYEARFCPLCGKRIVSD